MINSILSSVDQRLSRAASRAVGNSEERSRTSVRPGDVLLAASRTGRDVVSAACEGCQIEMHELGRDTIPPPTEAWTETRYSDTELDVSPRAPSGFFSR